MTTRLSLSLCRYCLAGLIAVLLPLDYAKACEFWYDPWGVLRGNCRLSDFFQDYDYEIAFNPNADFRIHLPNLRIAKIKYESFGGPAIDLFIDEENVGTRAAGEHAAAIVVSILQPGTTQIIDQQAFARTLPSLAAGVSVRHSIGTAQLPDRKQDYDLSVAAMVDPPTSALPGGEVFESNETDNDKTDLCRIYGPNPDLNGPPACD